MRYVSILFILGGCLYLACSYSDGHWKPFGGYDSWPPFLSITSAIITIVVASACLALSGGVKRGSRTALLVSILIGWAVLLVLAYSVWVHGKGRYELVLWILMLLNMHIAIYFHIRDGRRSPHGAGHEPTDQ